MTDSRLDGRARQRRDVGGVDAEQREIAAGIAADERRRRRVLPVGKTDLDLLVPLHDVVGGDDQPVSGPDDPAGRVAAARVDRDDGGPGAFDGPGELVGDTGQQRRGRECG